MVVYKSNPMIKDVSDQEKNQIPVSPSHTTFNKVSIRRPSSKCILKAIVITNVYSGSTQAVWL